MQGRALLTQLTARHDWTHSLPRRRPSSLAKEHACSNVCCHIFNALLFRKVQHSNRLSHKYRNKHWLLNDLPQGLQRPDRAFTSLDRNSRRYCSTAALRVLVRTLAVDICLSVCMFVSLSVHPSVSLFFAEVTENKCIIERHLRNIDPLRDSLSLA